MTISQKPWLVAAGLSLIAAVAVAWTSGPVGEGGEKAAAKEATAAKVIVPFYGNKECPFSGNPVDEGNSISHDGESIYFCCKDCKAMGAKDPASAHAKAYAKKNSVGNKTCPISGRPIDAAKAKTVSFQGQEAEVCCGGCVSKFDAAPALNLTKATHPDAKVVNTACPIMDGDADPNVHAVYKNHIVQFCCAGCIKPMIESPEETLAAAMK